MAQREAFVQAAEQGEESFSALCRRYQVSRKTGYKWLKRAREGQQLTDESRRPEHQPAKTPAAIEAQILVLREANPAWGGKMIKSVLEREGYQNIPSAKTCCTILKRNGCIDPEESKKHQPCHRFEREACNQLCTKK